MLIAHTFYIPVMKIFVETGMIANFPTLIVCRFTKSNRMKEGAIMWKIKVLNSIDKRYIALAAILSFFRSGSLYYFNVEAERSLPLTLKVSIFMVRYVLYVIVFIGVMKLVETAISCYLDRKSNLGGRRRG